MPDSELKYFHCTLWHFWREWCWFLKSWFQMYLSPETSLDTFKRCAQVFWRILLKAKLKLSAWVLISSFLIFLFTNLLLACFREPGRRPPSQLDLWSSAGSRGQCWPMGDPHSAQWTNQRRAQSDRERQQQKPSTKCQIEINVKNGLVCSELWRDA